MSALEPVRCLACDLACGRVPLPGGLIYQTKHWRVEHCIGPLGLGTLVLKPKRHVSGVSGLSDAESAELGPLIQRSAMIVDELGHPDQVYVCLWSHADRTPGHIHYVVQPVTRELMHEHGMHGPKLQARMFEVGETPPEDAIEAFASQARAAFAGSPPP